MLVAMWWDGMKAGVKQGRNRLAESISCASAQIKQSRELVLNNGVVVERYRAGRRLVVNRIDVVRVWLLRFAAARRTRFKGGYSERRY
jgi:hypothetical protein